MHWWLVSTRMWCSIWQSNEQVHFLVVLFALHMSKNRNSSAGCVLVSKQHLFALQVLKLKVDLVSHLALNSKFTRRSAEFCLQELVDKVGDIKNGSSVKETLSCISEACGLEFISMEVSGEILIQVVSNCVTAETIETFKSFCLLCVFYFVQ